MLGTASVKPGTQMVNDLGEIRSVKRSGQQLSCGLRAHRVHQNMHPAFVSGISQNFIPFLIYDTSGSVL